VPVRYPTVVLQAGREKAILKGHPWVFSRGIKEVRGSPEPGDVVLILASDGSPLALGFYNAHCDIAVRVISRHPEAEINEKFWRLRIRCALALRKRIVPEDTTAFRLVNAEGDGIPGLVVDRYAGFLVISIETAGVERLREAMVRLLAEETQVQGIYERSSGQARGREGLPERQGTLWGKDPPGEIEIREYGNRFFVDVKTGQKTGFFLDQRENRKTFQNLSAQARVLNCFSYTGAFSVYALKGRASEVVSMDISEKALQMIDRHLDVNGLDRRAHRAICADVFDYLRYDNTKYELICLDPPPFARTRGDLRPALRGYRDINRLALKRLADNGLLVTFSCSGAVDEEMFFHAVSQAAREAGCVVKLLARLGPAGDHPIQLVHPEGRYLKGLILTVLERHEQA